VPKEATAEVRLAAFVAGNLEWAAARPALAQVFSRALLAGDAPTRALVLEAAAHCIDVVASILAPELPPGLPAEPLAVHFICHANLLLGQSWATGWPAPEELPEVTARLFLRGLSDAV
jgi:hypothetical protein